MPATYRRQPRGPMSCPSPMPTAPPPACPVPTGDDMRGRRDARGVAVPSMPPPAVAAGRRRGSPTRRGGRAPCPTPRAATAPSPQGPPWPPGGRSRRPRRPRAGPAAVEDLTPGRRWARALKISRRAGGWASTDGYQGGDICLLILSRISDERPADHRRRPDHRCASRSSVILPDRVRLGVIAPAGLPQSTARSAPRAARRADREPGPPAMWTACHCHDKATEA